MRLLRSDGWNVDPEAWSTYQERYVTVCPRIIKAVMAKAGDIFDDHEGRTLTRTRETVRELYDLFDRNEAGQSRHLSAEISPDFRMGVNFYRGIEREG